MTQAEKIAKLLEAMEQLELAMASNDRQKQLEYARKAGDIRRGIK